MACPFRIAAWLSCCAVAAPLAAATPDAGRPRRLIHWFDFEERKLGNYEPMPRYWFAIGRDPQMADPTFLRQPVHQELVGRMGFPSFAEVHFAEGQATSGRFSFYLGLDGGSAGAFLQNGAIPAVPDSDYLITANVRTDKLQRAAARLRAYFIDNRGQRMEDSMAVSPAVRSGGKWTTVSVQLDGEYPDADYIGIEIELRQPRADPEAPLGKHQVVLQDVIGEAWFDDIAIWQLPHVQIATQSPVNVIAAPRRPRLTLNVRDLTGQTLYTDLVLYNHGLDVVARQKRKVGGGLPNQWGWTPSLPGFGWYLIDLQVYADAERSKLPLTRTLGAVLWLPEQKFSHADGRRFAIGAEALPDEHLALLPELLKMAGLEATVISAWSRPTTLANLSARQDRLDEQVFALRAAGGQIVMSLDPVPAELARAQGVDVAQPLAIMQADPQSWLPYLAPVLMRHGQRVSHWQLGSVRQPFAFFYENLPQIVSQVDRSLRALAPHPSLILPWRMDQSPRRGIQADAPLIYAMDVPPSVVPSRLAEYLQPWTSPSDSTAPGLWLHLRSPPADTVAHPQRVTDLALRMMYGWEAGAGALALDRPWTTAAERRVAFLPDPLLGVFANTAHRLAGRRVRGRLPVEDGIDCMILSAEQRKSKSARGGNRATRRTDDGMLAVWNRRAKQAFVLLEMYLGQSPVAVDIWGNREPISQYNGKHRLVVDSTPRFIEGVDAELALLRSSFKVEPSFIESRQQPQSRTMLLTNPWPRTISGQIQILGPRHWRCRPAHHYFSIAPGQSIKLPVTFTFPISEVAGAKKLQAQFTFTADRQYDVELAAPMELGLADVDFEANMALEPGSTPGTQDAVVVALVTNTGREAHSYFVFASMPGHPRQEIPISRLEAGQTVLRTFRFQDVGDTVEQSTLRAGVRHTNGPAMLNIKLSLNE